jgi:hypothetical protein
LHRYEKGQYREAIEMLKPALNKSLQAHSESDVLTLVALPWLHILRRRFSLLILRKMLQLRVCPRLPAR